jgi:diguanylate cyclase (GGDEF)-like protein
MTQINKENISFLGDFENISYDWIPDIVIENTRSLYQKLIEVNKKNIDLTEFANTDKLTQINNRNGLYKEIWYQLKEIERTNKNFTIISIIDIDHFKIFNDTYWHEMWDKVLEEIAKIFKEETRWTDIVWRWWWEEFIIALTDTSLIEWTEKLDSIREKIQNTLNKRVWLDKEITISWWIKFVGKKDFDILEIEKSINEIISIADIWLYKAKNSWRNQILIQIEKENKNEYSKKL